MITREWSDRDPLIGASYRAGQLACSDGRWNHQMKMMRCKASVNIALPRAWNPRGPRPVLNLRPGQDVDVEYELKPGYTIAHAVEGREDCFGPVPVDAAIGASDDELLTLEQAEAESLMHAHIIILHLRRHTLHARGAPRDWRTAPPYTDKRRKVLARLRIRRAELTRWRRAYPTLLAMVTVRRSPSRSAPASGRPRGS